MLPDFKLIGPPQRFKNGRGQCAESYAQKYRLLADPSRKVRSVALQTDDATVARRRAVRYVEEKLQRELLARDPQSRTVAGGTANALQEYLDDLTATGNSAKQVATVKTRIERVINQAKLKDYAQVDAVVVTKAIAKLADKYGFGAVTANPYREAMRAWSRWMKRNRRWPVNVLEDMAKIKGDTSNSRPRAILTDKEFEALLRVTKAGPERRNLSGEQRCQLYAIAAMTGLRAQELNSLKPTSFHLDADPAYITIHCTISKRRKTDHILLRRDFAELLRPWLMEQDLDRRLWGCSESWFYKASGMLRADLAAAGIAHECGGAQIDFHSFRAFHVTRAILTGRSSRAVMAHVRLSSEALLGRYLKLPSAAVVDVVDAVPLPKLPA